jgi:hypothetical protein
VARTTADEKRRKLAAIFDSITTSAEGVNRLEPCESWRPYVVAAMPQPVEMREGPTERKTGLEPAKSTRSVTMNATGRIQIRAA